MDFKITPRADERISERNLRISPLECGPASSLSDSAGPLVDTRHRGLRDLRISVTDRCNFRCVYCMPKEVFGRDYEFLPRSELLSFEEWAIGVANGHSTMNPCNAGIQPLVDRAMAALKSAPVTGFPLLGRLSSSWPLYTSLRS